MAKAQSSPPYIGVLDGIVRDSEAGRPMEKMWVCGLIRYSRSSARYKCAPVDSSGAYRLDSLPLRGVAVNVDCETVRNLTQITLVRDSVEFPPSAHLRRDWTVSRVGCDLRPIRRITKVFRGYYTPGFESSEFVPCASDGWFISGDSLGGKTYDDLRAWAEWKPGAMQRLRWPRLKRDEYGNSRYYVRWRATVVGPGQYGHMGISPFEIRVDSVLELRAPGKRDCR